MESNSNLRMPLASLAQLAKRIVPAGIVGLATGSACALFLWSLDLMIRLRFDHPWLLFLLPVSGLAVAWLYETHGKSVQGGNNLLIDEIHAPGGGVPLRMAPFVLIGTLLTHLCGGSAGREGTAVQMGGSLAGGLARLIPGFDRHDVRILLFAGIAAGFGGVFGTPVAGTIFALEVVVLGRMSYAALLPCLFAAVVASETCLAWGVGHTHYHLTSIAPPGFHAAPFDLRIILAAAAAGVLFGLTGRLFAEMTHAVHRAFEHHVKRPLLRPVVGGLLTIALVYALGTQDYLGLGVTNPDPAATTIVGCFHAGGAHPWSWWWKIVFTAVTLGSGFKGGEVTPLFFIGAALGNVLATAFGLPVDLFAGLGFVAVFAGATNTPLACTIMAVELFGGEYTLHFAVACLTAYLCSGHSGIYLSQRVGTPKRRARGGYAGRTLRTIRSARKSPRTWWNRLKPESPRAETPSQSAPGAESPSPAAVPDRCLPKPALLARIRIAVPDAADPAGLGPREWIEAARAAGLTRAVSYAAADDLPHLDADFVRVELTGDRTALEAFVRLHADRFPEGPPAVRDVRAWDVAPPTASPSDL